MYSGYTFIHTQPLVTIAMPHLGGSCCVISNEWSNADYTYAFSELWIVFLQIALKMATVFVRQVRLSFQSRSENTAASLKGGRPMSKVVHSKEVVILFQTTGRSTEYDKKPIWFISVGPSLTKLKVIRGTPSRKNFESPNTDQKESAENRLLERACAYTTFHGICSLIEVTLAKISVFSVDNYNTVQIISLWSTTSVRPEMDGAVHQVQ